MSQQIPKANKYCVPTFNIFVLAFICLAIYYVAWVGYIGSDDWVYIQNARQRLTDPFLVGKNHWDVRLTLTWPMALSFKLFGESEYSAALPTLMYSFFTSAIILLFLLGRRMNEAALGIAALVATSPLLTINATSLRIDAVETFYVVASLLAYLSAMGRKETKWMLLLAGLCAGFAFVTRPTSVALVAFYGLLFIYGYGMPRARYLIIALGFIAVWLSESLYYWYSTGNPIYRFTVDFNHDQVVRAGNLFEAVIVAPAKMVFGSHGIGPTYWLLPLAISHIIRNKLVDPETRAIAIVFTAFSVVWIIIFSGFASKLVLDPRYLAPSIVTALVVIGLWLVSLIRMKKLKLVLLLTLVLLGSHALAIYLENKAFSYAQRWLTQLASTYESPIYTDPQTYERALFFLEIQGVKHKVIPAPAPSGGLFLEVPENSARGFYNGISWVATDYAAGEWPVIERLAPPRKAIGALLEDVRLDQYIPEGILKKMNYPNPPVTLYQRP